MRVDINSPLSSNSAFKKNSNSTRFIDLYSGASEQSKHLQSFGQDSSLSPSLSPCRSSCNHSRRLFQKTIENFDCKINGQAIWAVLWSLSGSDGQAQTQGVSESAESLRAPARRAATGSLEKNVLPLLRY